MMKSINCETSICNARTQQNLCIFHPLSYKNTTCFDLRPLSSTVIQKCSHTEDIQHIHIEVNYENLTLYLILSILCYSFLSVS